MAGNFGEPFQHFSDQNVYKDTGKINTSECLKYGVGEKLDYSKLTAEQLKKVPKVIVKKLANAGKYDFQFQLKNLKKSDQDIVKTQFFIAVYDQFRSTMLHGIRLIKKILNTNEPQMHAVQTDTALIRQALQDMDRRMNKIHQEYLTGTETKESLILQLDIIDLTAKQIWNLIQVSLGLVENAGRRVTSIEPGEQPSTSRWTGP